MRALVRAWALFLLVLASCNSGSGKRILVVTPAPSYSHQIVFRTLCLELNRVGHEIVTLTPNPVKDPTLRNYTEIDFNYEYKRLDDTDFSQIRWNLTNLGGLKTRLLELGHIIAEDVLDNPYMKKVYEPGNGVHFDAVIVEMTMTPALYALAHRFDAPLIGIMSMDMQTYHRFLLGSPILPSHVSNWELEAEGELNPPFWRRTKNFVATWWSIFRWYYGFLRRQQEVAVKYFGKDVPQISDITSNMSLVLVNHESSISYARPELPNVIHYSGFHLKDKPPPLSKDLQEFLDSATNGFIYMSLGTNVRSHLLPKEKLRVFVQAFANLPYKILWKLEDRALPVPDNVYITDWVPQQGVLAHRNIKLFIYQGGLQSTEEAVHYGVPLVGIPFVFDQAYQVMRMVSLGVAREVDILDINIENFSEAVYDVLTNYEYKRKMMELRSFTKDKPFNTLKHAVWWVEFVMRHKGAPHLHFSMADDAWYQRYDVDVIAFIGVVAFLLMLLLIAIIARGVSYAVRHYQRSSSKIGKKLD